MGSVYFNAGAIDNLLRSPVGPVGRDIARRTLKAQAVARATCPRGPGRPGRRHLADTIEAAVVQTPDGLAGIVGSADPVMRYVSKGTRPHTIEARNAKVLAFQVDGVDVFVTAVRHPGTKPNDFMLKALAAAGL